MRSEITLPSEFLIIYECEGCGSDYEMFNCLVPRIPLWCDECNQRTYFYSEEIVHRSWEWDRWEECIDNASI